MLLNQYSVLYFLGLRIPMDQQLSNERGKNRVFHLFLIEVLSQSTAPKRRQRLRFLFIFGKNFKCLEF